MRFTKRVSSLWDLVFNEKLPFYRHQSWILPFYIFPPKVKDLSLVPVLMRASWSSDIPRWLSDYHLWRHFQTSHHHSHWRSHHWHQHSFSWNESVAQAVYHWLRQELKESRYLLYKMIILRIIITLSSCLSSSHKQSSSQFQCISHQTDGALNTLSCFIIQLSHRLPRSVR